MTDYSWILYWQQNEKRWPVLRGEERVLEAVGSIDRSLGASPSSSTCQVSGVMKLSFCVIAPIEFWQLKYQKWKARCLSLSCISQSMGCIPMWSPHFRRYKIFSNPELMKMKLLPFKCTVNPLIIRKKTWF